MESEAQESVWQKRVLVVSAHFDDEVIGCGGALLRHAEAGAAIMPVYLSAGDCGDTKLALSGDETKSIRSAEAAAVAERLGADRVACLDGQEGFLEQDDRMLRRRLVTLIRDFRPSLVYAPHMADGHPDHRAASVLARDCAALAGYRHFPELGDRHKVDAVRYYEVWVPIQAPNLYVDVSRHRTAKSELLGLYQSQLAIVDYVAAVEGLNAFRGSMGAGCDAAEAFIEERLRPVVLGAPAPGSPSGDRLMRESGV